MINCHFLNKHVGSGGGGGAAARFHSSNIFLKFTYRKLKQHGAAPSPLPTHTFWEHLKVKVKNRKLSLKSKLYIFDPLSQQHTHTHIDWDFHDLQTSLFVCQDLLESKNGATCLLNLFCLFLWFCLLLYIVHMIIEMSYYWSYTRVYFYIRDLFDS